MKARSNEAGITYVELIATASILAILALAIIPTAKVGRRRAKEVELRRTIREIHACIDEFKYRAQAQIGQVPPPGDGIVFQKDPPYPEKLEDLVEGVEAVGRPPGTKWKCLRSMPIDPITETREWHLCCSDDRESDDSCSGPVGGIWKVTSTSSQTALDGKTRYNDCKSW